MAKIDHPILMGKTNPNGYMLEDLLAVLQSEILVKCRSIEDQVSDPSQDSAQAVFFNNKSIIRLLGEAEVAQRRNLRLLNEIGVDEGPLGKPRIGE